MDMKINNDERISYIFGVFLFLLWGIIVSLLIRSQISSEQSSIFFSNQIFSWIIYGPLVTFVILGHYILYSRNRDELARKKDIKNIVLSLVCFGAWLIVNIICWLIQIDIPLLVNVLIGYILVIAIYLIFNRS
jgi:hypothetical protein